MEKKELRLLEKGLQMAITNKLIDRFAEVEVTSEPDLELRAQIFSTIGKALGETLDTIEVPIHWRRFIKRKDCPKYLKEIMVYHANAYYPKISLPEREPYITFDSGGHADV